jgi:hypothetical protein
MTNLRIYGLLRLGEDLRDTEAQLNIFDFLTETDNLTYDWDTSKLKLMLTFDTLESLLAVEDYLLNNIQGIYTATFDVSADIEHDKFAEQQFTYRLSYAPTLDNEVKQMLLKLFPAEHLIN